LDFWHYAGRKNKMSETLLLGLVGALVTLVSIGGSQLISWWIAKKKLNPEINQIKAGTSVSTADLAEKLQTLADKAVNKNIALEKQLEEEGATHQATEAELMKEIEKLRGELKQLREDFEKEKEENKKLLEAERAKCELLDDYNIRLLATLTAYRIPAPPYDTELYKQNILNDVNSNDSIKDS
jgi:hypothetical protein